MWLITHKLKVCILLAPQCMHYEIMQSVLHTVCILANINSLKNVLKYVSASFLNKNENDNTELTIE